MQFFKGSTTGEGRENEKHGNWVRNFNNLKSNQLIFPSDTFDGYELKDSIFEIYKLVLYNLLIQEQ
ncbi:MAG: hypothetical protein ACTSRT_19375 [Promethearchaeota archaeon]